MDKKSVYWLLQRNVDLPEDDNWLSAGERLLLQGLKFPKRIGEWRLGRWTAKQLIRSYLKITDGRDDQFPELEILPTEDGSPQVSIQKTPFPLTISISHRAGAGFCAISRGADNLGCDLEIIEERSDAFVTDYFTFEERLKVIVAAEEDKPLLANLIWSAKESVLKTLRQGLTSDTRNVLIDLNDLAVKKGWNEINARSPELNKGFYGWWQVKERYILTIFSSEITEVPVELPTS